MTNSIITCEAFDAELPDYLEGTLDGQVRAQVDQHLRECVRCASLLRDIEQIRNEASALPDLVPSRDLWAGIEARIAAPVIPLVARPEKHRRVSPTWMGIAAAALVVTTAGLTYTLTARSMASRESVVSQTSAVPQAQTNVAPSITASTGSTASTEPERANAPAGREPNAGGGSFVQAPTARSRNAIPATLATQSVEQAPSYSEVVYGKEIALLQRILNDKKSTLDPSTVMVIERNLQIIDAAIEQSKAALAKDPASMLLSGQLSHALDKKVELLRTAAMLPAST